MSNLISGSSDTLPPTGYTADQLAEYIKRQLGSPVWELEITKQQILDCIQDAVNMFSMWKPRIRYHTLKLSSGIHRYLQGVELGTPEAPSLGIAHVWFVEPNPVPTEIFYGNLIDPAPLFRTGLDDYDMFLRWRKTWMRVTSIQPDWTYDEFNQTLLIHNPIARYHCALMLYVAWPINKLSFFGADWVKKYALEKSRYVYGEVLSKYSGALPGPVKDLQLDNQKRTNAKEAMDKLEETLRKSQELTPISID